MMFSKKVQINPNVLRWARESHAVDISLAAKTVKVDPTQYAEWEHGTDYPSLAKLRQLANLYKRPLAVFFLRNIPKDIPFPQDFRLLFPGEQPELSSTSRLAIKKAIWKQNIAKEIMGGADFSTYNIILKSDISSVAEKIRTITIETQLSWTNEWQALKEWKNFLETKGVFVFQYSMPMEEIRGCSLLREGFPPAIVINSKDSPAGRIFTLFHEYCHILLNTSGICNPKEGEQNNNAVEKDCNRFSGEFLVPTQSLASMLTRYGNIELLELLNMISNKYKVSRFVILKRLYDLNKISYQDYKNTYQNLFKAIKKFSSGGGNYFKNKYAENGRKFINLIAQAETAGAISTSEALEALDIKLNHYDRLTDMLYE